MDQPTKFSESNALLWLAEGNWVAARESLEDYSVSELSYLMNAAKRLVALCENMMAEEGRS